MERATTPVALTASGGAIICGLTLNDLAMWVGIFCAVLTLLINAFFQWRRDVREELAFQARLRS